VWQAVNALNGEHNDYELTPGCRLDLEDWPTVAAIEQQILERVIQYQGEFCSAGDDPWWIFSVWIEGRAERVYGEAVEKGEAVARLALSIEVDEGGGE